jgi:hypothetical protein
MAGCMAQRGIYFQDRSTYILDISNLGMLLYLDSQTPGCIAVGYMGDYEGRQVTIVIAPSDVYSMLCRA